MLLIGTSGWSYKDWRGRFYPPGTAVDDYLAFYSRTFSTVEINNSFYRLPPPESFKRWARATPEDFIFSVKASRYISHVKKLKGIEGPLKRFLSAASGLGRKLGPVLFQFPANWKANPARLSEMLDLAPEGFRYVFEFRHPSWFQEDVYDLLAGHGAALCLAYSEKWPNADKITADFVFIRLHGQQPTYASKYSHEELKDLAAKIATYRRLNFDIFVYFNNDANAFAVQNALELRELTGAGYPSPEAD